jgi:hypothetical protein
VLPHAVMTPPPVASLMTGGSTRQTRRRQESPMALLARVPWPSRAAAAALGPSSADRRSSPPCRCEVVSNHLPPSSARTIPMAPGGALMANPRAREVPWCCLARRSLSADWTPPAAMEPLWHGGRRNLCRSAPPGQICRGGRPGHDRWQSQRAGCLIDRREQHTRADIYGGGFG